jgi:hypothetical protein
MSDLARCGEHATHVMQQAYLLWHAWAAAWAASAGNFAFYQGLFVPHTVDCMLQCIVCAGYWEPTVCCCVFPLRRGQGVAVRVMDGHVCAGTVWHFLLVRSCTKAAHLRQ